MKKLTKFIWSATLSASLLLASPAVVRAAESNAAPATARPESRLTELFGDPVVAKGKGLEIKYQSQLDAELSRTKSALAARGGNVPAGLEPQVLDGMIGLKLLLSKATDADRTKAKEQFEKSFTDYKKAQNITDEQFNERLMPELKAQGRSREDWEKQQLDQAIIPIVVERELKTAVTEDQAKKYYEDNPSKFEVPETVRVSHILLSTKDANDKTPDPAQRKELPDDQKKAKRKQMEDILKRAKAGEDFTKLANEFSEDPGVKQNHGEYKFSREDPFVPEFKSAAFSLNTNQVSDIVTSMFGYHILKLWEKMPAKKEPYNGVATKTIYRKPDNEAVTVKDVLTEETMRKELPDYIKKLKKDADLSKSSTKS